MYPSRDVSKINTNHHLYNKPQTPKARYASKRNWLLFQVNGAMGNIPNAALQTDRAFREVEGKSLEERKKHNEIMIAAANAEVALKDLYRKIKAFNE
jgi:hypothetical protein